MNTPAHAVVNLLLLSRRRRPEELAPITAGAVLPDLAMVVFYACQKAAGTAERVIWSERYFAPAWQSFFDLWNSLPLIAVGLLVARWLGRRRWALLFASMGLHALEDLPLHHDDAHRHFFPFSDWRFASPISYWDPARHGGLVTLLEIALVAVAVPLLLRRHPGRGPRVLVLALAAVYALYFAYVFAVWA
ncbi:MAG: hypothetical protein D6696_14700 [Acidobacteria bacterium]|nr:MAG: hypothetical protein D6696_14700 [Acidobacteriota bacterium]